MYGASFRTIFSVCEYIFNFNLFPFLKNFSDYWIIKFWNSWPIMKGIYVNFIPSKGISVS